MIPCSYRPANGCWRGDFEVEIAETVPQALALLVIPDSRPFDLILLCHSLNGPGMQGASAMSFSAMNADTRVLQLNEGWRDLRTLTGPLEQVSAARPQTLIQKITEACPRSSQCPAGSTDSAMPADSSLSLVTCPLPSIPESLKFAPVHCWRYELPLLQDH